jgi:hypothetical protein
MKHIVIAVLFLSVSGCGVEAVGTAATGAGIKKQELEQGQQTMRRMEERVGQMNLDAADRMQGLDDE